MENNKAMNITTASKLDLALAEVRGEATVTRLRTRHARKGETHYTTRTKASGSGQVLGSLQEGDRATGVACGKGNSGTITPRCGIGKQMVADLDKVKRSYAKQAKADRRAAALERAAERD